MFDAVPYLPDELVDPLGGYAELSSRFASGDGWKEDLRSADLVKASEHPGQRKAVGDDSGMFFRGSPAPVAVHE